MSKRRSRSSSRARDAATQTPEAPEGAPGATSTAAAGTRPRAAVVHNPVKVDREVIGAAMEELERELGWAPTLWLETSVEDPGTGQARQALDEGVDVVIGAGGDGTIRAVAEGLAGSGTPMGIVPAGTGNVLARNVGVPLGDLRGQLRLALTGQARSVDVAIVQLRRADGRVDRQVSVVMAGMGIDAAMLAETDEDLKKRAGWLAYLKAIVTVLRQHRELTFRYRIDDGPVRRLRADTVIVGNCGVLPGSLVLLPDAAIDDGLLDVMTLSPKNLYGWLTAVRKVIWVNGVLRGIFGRTSSGPTASLTYTAAHRIEIRLEDEQDVEIDGEPVGRAIAMRTWVEQGALLVASPAVPPGTPAPEVVGQVVPSEWTDTFEELEIED